MDAVGFRVRNKDKILQIDGQYKNHALLQKVTLQPTNQVFGDNSLRYIDIPIPQSSTIPLLALRCDFYCFYTMADASTYRIFTKRTPSTEAPPTVDVYIFGDPPATTASGGIGFRVRNQVSGAVVFDSNYKYLRVLGYYTNTSATPSSPITFPGRKVALVQGVRSYGAFKDRSGFVVIDSTYSGVMSTPSESAAVYQYIIVRSFNLPWDGGSYPRYDYSSLSNSFMVIDVTNF